MKRKIILVNCWLKVNLVQTSFFHNKTNTMGEPTKIADTQKFTGKLKVVSVEYSESPLIGDDKVVGYIYETYNYSKFKFMPRNRDRIERNKKRLRASIAKVGQLQNVLVDAEFNVGEGQHRVEVLEELGLPVRYEVRSRLEIKEIQEIQKAMAWNTQSYLKSYVQDDDKATANAYKIYQEFSKRFKMPHNMVLAFLSGSYSNSVPTETFKEGKLKVTIEQAERAMREATMLEEFMPLHKKWNTRPFILAFFTLLKKYKGYNHDHMIRNTEKYRADLHPHGKAEHYVKNLIEVYNKYLPKHERLLYNPDLTISGS